MRWVALAFAAIVVAAPGLGRRRSGWTGRCDRDRLWCECSTPRRLTGTGDIGVSTWPGHRVSRCYAAGAGTVVFAGELAGRPLVSIAHPGGLRTSYEPVVPSVRAGQRVDAGAVVGELRAGHAGCRGGGLPALGRDVGPGGERRLR